ncbi:zf-TFIIB domain-containing protein, partial [Candidatus Woesearchaeota archaeon]|nr:zf-TFIIB domain-containing protein [Candidatus Woesearchaeota archaeon]
MDEIIDCPRCHKKMKQATREDVTIDYCKKCGGLWLDKGEMEKIIE